MNAKMEIDDTDESVDTDGGAWKQQRKEKKKSRKRIRKSESMKSGFNCDQCENTIDSKTGLAKHKESHLVFGCIQCDTKNLCEEDLRDHMKMHNQEKFSCEKCDEVFQVEDDLRKHRLCHDSDQCDKIYTSNRELKEHGEFHSRKKFWKCNYCDTILQRKACWVNT